MKFEKSIKIPLVQFGNGTLTVSECESKEEADEQLLKWVKECCVDVPLDENFKKFVGWVD